MSAFGQMELRIPIDSAEYISFISAEGEQLTDWKKLDDVRPNFMGDYHLAKTRAWGITDDELNFIVQPAYSKIELHGPHIFAQGSMRLAIYDQDLKLKKEFDQFLDVEFLYDREGNDRAFSRREDVILIKTLEGCWVLSEELEVLSDEPFEDAFGMNGIVYLRNGEQFGFVSNTGKVFRPKWSSIATFDHQVMELTDEQGKRHYIARNGFVFPDSDSTLIRFPGFNEYKVYQGGKGKIVAPDKEGRLNYSGEDIFPIGSSTIQFDSDGERLGKKYAFKRNGKIGLLDNQGNTLIPPVFDQIEYGNREVVIYMKGMKYGLMTISGSIIYDTLFTYIDHAREEYFEVYRNGKKGIVDTKGRIIVPVRYDDVGCQTDGIITLNQGRWGFYTYDGKECLRPEYRKVTKENGGLEFISDAGRVMVSKNGLITPINCDRISRFGDRIKYYKGDKIVHCELNEEGSIQDTTVYQRPRSIRITATENERPFSLHDNRYAEIRWQKSGKVGAISKHGRGFGVLPQFDNVMERNGPMMGIVRREDYFRLDYALLSAKEKLVPFYPSSGRIYSDVFAYQQPMKKYSWHSSQYDPVIDKDKKVQFYNDNEYQSESNFIHPRKGLSSKSLMEGGVGFSAGNDFLAFKDYYQSVNAYYNLKIDSKGLFSLLSRNPNLQVSEDALWKVRTFVDFLKIGISDYFKVYEEVNAQYALASKDGKQFGVVKEGKDFHVPLECSKVEFVQIGPSTYFKVQMQDETVGGVSTAGWTIYDDDGRVFGELYDEVDVLGLNIFKLVRGDTYLIVDESGQEIYRSRPGFLVEN